MFFIRFRTQVYRPDLLVTLRTSTESWTSDIPGIFEDDEWKFELSDEQYSTPFNFKFVLEREYWQNGGNIYLEPKPNGNYTYDQNTVQFPLLTEALVENTFVQQFFFPPSLQNDRVYDVLVIGSGIGGGILADQLSDRGVNVLVLELGSYLLPTHVGNLPRRHLIGQFDKNIWGLYNEFKVTNYVNADGSQFRGGQGFNLGGRSVFWGGLIPRMLPWEMDSWPAAVKTYLPVAGYHHAEDMLCQVAQPPTPYQQTTKNFLRDILPGFNHFDAPMAVSSVNPSTNAIPVGMFSTADLLMESKLTKGAQGNQTLILNLNQAVTKIETEGQRATQVVAFDLIAKEQRKYKAKYVVLSAGTIESAKIAQLSGLNDPNNKIGVGFTDHTIYYTHFCIPPTSPSYMAYASSKTASQFKDISATNHPYNIVIELGSDLNQGRFTDPAILVEHNQRKGNTMLCEIVFLFASPLMDGNSVRQQGPSFAKPIVNMQPATNADAYWGEINDIKNTIIQKLGGEAIYGDNIDLKRADLGGVAHEVGTLRMSDRGDGVVDENLKFLSYDNLYACDLSVLPTSPAANPTLTLTALAIRLADHLKSRL